ELGFYLPDSVGAPTSPSMELDGTAVWNSNAGGQTVVVDPYQSIRWAFNGANQDQAVHCTNLSFQWTGTSATLDHISLYWGGANRKLASGRPATIGCGPLATA